MSNLTAKIQTIWNPRRREITFALIIFMVATLSFGLGYLANRELNHPPIVIEKCSSPS